jgi:hypothetical protein
VVEPSRLKLELLQVWPPPLALYGLLAPALVLLSLKQFQRLSVGYLKMYTCDESHSCCMISACFLDITSECAVRSWSALDSSLMPLGVHTVHRVTE